MPDLSVNKSSSKSLHDSKKPSSRTAHSIHVKHSNLKDNRSPRRRFHRSRQSSSASSDSSSSSSLKIDRKKAVTDSTKFKERAKTQSKHVDNDLKSDQISRKGAPYGNSEATVLDNSSKISNQQPPSRNSNPIESSEKSINNSGPSRNENSEMSLRNTKPKKDNVSDGPKEPVSRDCKRIIVEKLTKNITTAHIMEIFSIWGQVHDVDLLPDRIHPEFNRGYGFVEYIDAKNAALAVNSMNGGQIDGQEVRVSFDQERTFRRRSPIIRRHDFARRRHSRSRSANNLNLRKTKGIADRNVRPPHDRDRRRDRRDLPSNAANRPCRTRRGSSGSPFASRPSRGRGRSPGSRYRRPSPPNDIPASKRARSRTPPKLQRLPTLKAEDGLSKQPIRNKTTSRSSSSSSSSSNSSSSSGGSSSSSSASSTSS